MKIQGWLAIGLVGAMLCAPVVHAASSGSVSATCKDGTTWTGKSHSGACRGHQGVQSWSDEGASAPTATSETSSGTQKSHSKKSSGSNDDMSSSRMSSDTAASGGATATCKDGSSWSGKSHSGACRGHGGVQSWSESSAAAPASGPATSTVSSSSNNAGGVSATCKDGTTWSGKSHSGACRGHKGVQSWSGDEGATPAAAPPPMTPPIAAPSPTPMSPRPSNTPINKPVAHSAPMPTTPAPGGGDGKVWVNPSSKVYHCSNDRWYGKTKSGQYMSESQAKSQGFRPDHGKACS